jgi:hypothetical protein
LLQQVRLFDDRAPRLAQEQHVDAIATWDFTDTLNRLDGRRGVSVAQDQGRTLHRHATRQQCERHIHHRVAARA